MKFKVPKFQNEDSVQHYQIITKWSSKMKTKVAHTFSIQKVPDNLGVRKVNEKDVIGPCHLAPCSLSTDGHLVEVSYFQLYSVFF